jgi:uroporphyrinogen-III synthase
MRLLVTRPLPAGAATADRLRALGHSVTLAPLMVTEAVAWDVPDPLPGAVMLTSGFAARLAGPDAPHHLPVFAVGSATAGAALDAGFADVREGGGTVQATLDTVGAAGFASLLHLAGEDRTPAVVPAGLAVTTCTVYRARLVPLEALPAVDWVLLYSPRSAAHFAAEARRLSANFAQIGVATISAATLAAAGPGWRATAVGHEPTEDALLAAIGISCDEGAPKGQ